MAHPAWTHLGNKPGQATCCPGRCHTSHPPHVQMPQAHPFRAQHAPSFPHIHGPPLPMQCCNFRLHHHNLLFNFTTWRVHGPITEKVFPTHTHHAFPHIAAKRRQQLGGHCFPPSENKVCTYQRGHTMRTYSAPHKPSHLARQSP